MVQLEDGKFYKTRDGRKAGPMRNERFRGWFDVSESVTKSSWDSRGSFIPGAQSTLDLVEEWKDYKSCESAQVDVQREEYGSASTGAQREKLNGLPYDLVPFQEIAEAYARVAEFGAVKYSAWNWSKGLPRVQILGSLLRHTWAYLRGEDYDSDSKLLHTDHIIWNAATLVHNVHWNLADGRRGEPSREYKISD